MSFVYGGITYPSPGDQPAGSGPLTAGLTGWNDPANWVSTGSNDSGATSTFAPPPDSQLGQLIAAGKFKLPDAQMMGSGSQGATGLTPEWVNQFWGQLPSATINGRQWAPENLTALVTGDQRKLLNSGYTSDDAHYGRITPTMNLAPSNDWLDKIGGSIPSIVAAIAGALTLNPAMLGAGFTGGLGAVGGDLFKTLLSTLFQSDSKGG